jgi:hypothetical protein
MKYSLATLAISFNALAVLAAPICQDGHGANLGKSYTIGTYNDM